MAGYIGTQAVSVNTTSATISDDLAVGDDLTVTDDATIGGTALVTGVLTTTAATVFNGGFTANAASTISTDGNEDTLVLKSNDADANAGPKLQFNRNSASPADGDRLGEMRFSGRNDAGQAVEYATFRVFAADVSDGTEDTEAELTTILAGTEVARMTMVAAETVFNQAGAAVNFRVESDDNANMLFVDAANDRLQIGSATTDDDQMFQLIKAGASAGFGIHTNRAAAGGSALIMSHNRNASVGSFTILNDGDTLGRITFQGCDGGDIKTEGAQISAEVNGTPGANDLPTKLVFSVTADGANTISEAMRISQNGNMSIGHNTSNFATLDVRESANQAAMSTRNTNANMSQDLHSWFTNRANTDAFNFWRVQTSKAGTADNELILNGAGALSIEGALTQNGADYAEYFEWADGNGSSEDRIGISVKLDGAKIVPSTSSDNTATIIGVVSGNAGVLGDAAYIKWQGKFLKDDYGRVIRETYTNTEWTVEEFEHSYQTDYIPSDLTVPSDAVVVSRDNNNNLLTRKKVNPNWDATDNYIPWAERKEWDAIGIMGKLRINKGQRTGTNWIKLRDVSDTVEEWLVR